MVITAGYVAAIFWLTSRRSLVAPATLAIGLGAGGGGGAPDPWPEPGPPGGRRLPDAGNEEALLLLDRLDLDGEETRADLVGAAGVHAGPS